MGVTVTFVPASCAPPPLTLPPPAGSTLVVSVYLRTKCAVTERSALIVTVQVPDPVQAPDQRAKR